jgi:hypothetical protein
MSVTHEFGSSYLRKYLSSLFLFVSVWSSNKHNSLSHVIYLYQTNISLDFSPS